MPSDSTLEIARLRWGRIETIAELDLVAKPFVSALVKKAADMIQNNEDRADYTLRLSASHPALAFIFHINEGREKPYKFIGFPVEWTSHLSNDEWELVKR